MPLWKVAKFHFARLVQILPDFAIFECGKMKFSNFATDVQILPLSAKVAKYFATWQRCICQSFVPEFVYQRDGRTGFEFWNKAQRRQLLLIG